MLRDGTAHWAERGTCSLGVTGAQAVKVPKGCVWAVAQVRIADRASIFEV